MDAAIQVTPIAELGSFSGRFRSGLEPSQQDLERPLREKQASIAIVGGGFSAIATLNQIVKKVEERREQGEELPLIKIAVFAKDGIDRGIAYRQPGKSEDAGVFILNQPADFMSWDPQDKQVYTKWLHRNNKRDEFGKQLDGDSFTSRALYGEAIEDLYRNSLLRAEALGIEVVTVKGAVTDLIVEPKNTGVRLEIAEAEGMQQSAFREQAGYTVLALGHSPYNPFPYLNGSDRYILRPFELTEYHQLKTKHPELFQAGEKDAKVALVGGASSSLDAIRALEHLGFQGRYVIVAPSPSIEVSEGATEGQTGDYGRPWSFDPEVYSRKSFADYRPDILTAESFSPTASFLTLGKKLGQELKAAQERGFGEGHVYFGLPLEEMKRKIEGLPEAETEGARQFIKYVTHMQGCATAPESASLYRQLELQGRIDRLEGRVTTSPQSSPNLAKEDGPLLLGTSMADGRTFVLEVDAAVNCCAFPKSHLSPTTARLADSVSTDPNSPLGLLGPPAKIGRRFGAETFAVEAEEQAEQALRLSFKNARLVKEGSESVNAN
ncbi:MAG: FAD/NAD(P)-binding protein [Bdellovibrionales bacterium]|nr:FAD/NAD(P)-binding protein [Bdellovibrionales bacterium]